MPRGLRGRAGALPARARAARRGAAATRCAPSGRRRRRGGSRCGLRRDPRRAAAARDRARAAPAARRRHPLAPAPLRLGRRLLAAGVRLRARARVAARRARRALVLRRPERRTSAPLDALAPIADRGRPGGAADRLGGDRAGSGRSTATPPTPPTPSSPASRCAGCGSGGSAAAPTTRRRPRRRARRQAARVPRRGRRAACASCAARARPARAARLRDRHRAARPLVVGGARLARRGARAAPRRPGCACSRCPQALAEHEPESTRPLARLDLGRGQGPAHLGLAAGRRPRLGARGGWSCACCARSAPRPRAAPPRQRAARELLAVQASDWAFLDSRGQAGDYAFQRATDHAEATARGHRLPRRAPDPRMRALAPDLSLAPLLEP